MTPAVANVIRLGEFPQLSTLIETGKRHGMCSQMQALRQLYVSGAISEDAFLRYARDLDEVQAFLKELHDQPPATS